MVDILLAAPRKPKKDRVLIVMTPDSFEAETYGLRWCKIMKMTPYPTGPGAMPPHWTKAAGPDIPPGDEKHVRGGDVQEGQVRCKFALATQELYLALKKNRYSATLSLCMRAHAVSGWQLNANTQPFSIVALHYSMKLGLERAVLGFLDSKARGDTNTKKAIEDLVRRGAYGAVLDQVWF
jgi:hypothetical protein